MRKMSATLVAVALLIAGCSAAPEREEATSQLEDGAKRESGSGERQSVSDRSGSSKGQDGEGSGDREHAGPKDSSTNSDAADGETADSSEQGSERSGDRSGSGPRTASTNSGAPQPRSGRYTYAQSGWEEFCAGTCRRDDLPPSAAIDSEVSSAGAGRLRVISESRSSEDRSMRTTSFVSRAVIELTELELNYGSFSNTYRPSPPVRSLELPLSVGRSWSSSWEADTSGTYSAEVLGREELVVGDRKIDTFKLDTLTRFRGDFSGTLSSVVWVDPDTGTTVRTHGKARIETNYGRFNSNFDTTLIDGPGYQ